MKRMIAILLAALMLTTVLTACSGTVGMDDGRAYGNVSTTPNGTVNGGEGYGNGYQSYDSGNYRNSGSNGSYGSYSNGYGGYGSNSSGSGTGMTGGR